MNEKNLVICDKVLRYGAALGEHISAREELSVKVYVCSSMEHVVELQKRAPIHIFLVEEGYSYEERKIVGAEYTVVLGETRPADLGDEEVYVRKYQNADSIVRDIFSAYIERTENQVVREGKLEQTSFVAIYSPIHRVGKTTFAKALAREWAKKERVLYLNMEEYAGLGQCQTEEWGIGDLLYFVKQGEHILGAKMQLTVQKDGSLEYFAPLLMSLDLKAVTYMEWKQLFKEIEQSGVYGKVVLDLGESVQGLFQILESCDRIYMPVLEDEISQNKVRQYEENLRRLSLEKMLYKTIQFVMPEQVEEYAKIRAKEKV